MKVLIAEDDGNLRRGLRQILEEEGYEVIEAPDGTATISLFHHERPDFVCLDIMMPGKSGYEVCKELRAIDSRVPIIFISAKSQEIDKVVGLELGADDYIMKPFGIREVQARIRAITRRCFREIPSEDHNMPFTMGDLTVFPAELRARRDISTIDLPLREVRILELLHREKGRGVDRDSLFDHCWGRNYLPNSRTLEQTISNLRKKIELDPKHPQIIKTVHGVGYRYE